MTVHVVLIEASSGATLGEVDLASEQLPESFHAPTTLHLGGEDWHVERAEPMTRAAYAAAGALTIWMTQVVAMDPKAILFSLPTIESVQPALSGPDGGGAAAWIHEDDWRQHEVVSARFADAIAADLAAIRDVIANHRRGAGYTKLHVRARIPEPLAGVSVRVAELGLTGRRDLALGPARGAGAIVAGGFAFAHAGGLVYGREEAGAIVALGCEGDGDGALRAIAEAHDLVLVDWVRAGEP